MSLFTEAELEWLERNRIIIEKGLTKYLISLADYDSQPTGAITMLFPRKLIFAMAYLGQVNMEIGFEAIGRPSPVSTKIEVSVWVDVIDRPGLPHRLLYTTLIVRTHDYKNKKMEDKLIERSIQDWRNYLPTNLMKKAFFSESVKRVWEE